MLFGAIACTSNPPATQATVTNTDLISISSELGVQNTTLIIDDVGGMAPGATRLVRMRGSFRRAGETGSNRFRFTGRLRGRRLRPGSYQLRAKPVADGVSGAVRRVRFRIVR